MNCYRKERQSLDDMVKNYKKMMLFSIGSKKIEDILIADLIADLMEARVRSTKDCYWRDSIISKIIVYLEFGFPYEKYANVFNSAIKIFEIDISLVWQRVDKTAQYIKPTIEELRKIIIWRSKHRHQYISKVKVLNEMVTIIKTQLNGTYQFGTELCFYQLEINNKKIVLENIIKGVRYLII